MNRQEAEHHYQDQGLVVEHGFDEANKVYEPHRHEKTFLYTLSGDLTVKLDDDDWRTVTPQTEVVIGTDQLHEAKVGEQGWEYVAAWDAEEAKQYAFDHP